jgi:hypothetical protein
MLRRVTLLLPLTFNDGSTIPKEALALIEDEIYAAFNGWTVVGEVQGTYRMQQTGRKQEDRLLKVWVVVPEAELGTFRQMVARYAALLDQERMYFEVSDARIEFIAPPPEEEQGHD